MMPSHIDELDTNILEVLLDDGRIKYKELSKKLGVDERLISRRVERLIEMGVITKFTTDINWKELGLEMQAFICTRTGAGENLMYSFHSMLKSQPRIVSADTTIGAYEYIIYAISKDLQDFRSKVGFPLEPFATNLATSIISDPIKSTDYKPLLRIVNELNYTDSSLDKKMAFRKVEKRQSI
jgi:Lrp/AsnC family leucine-responsive transcriptional regulator